MEVRFRDLTPLPSKSTHEGGRSFFAHFVALSAYAAVLAFVYTILFWKEKCTVTMFSKKENLLEQQERRANKLLDDSAMAVDVVMSMSERLQAVNDGIRQQTSEIDTCIDALAACREDLNFTLSKNERIMGNIKKLLEADC